MQRQQTRTNHKGESNRARKRQKKNARNGKRAENIFEKKAVMENATDENDCEVRRQRDETNQKCCLSLSWHSVMPQAAAVRATTQTHRTPPSTTPLSLSPQVECTNSIAVQYEYRKGRKHASGHRRQRSPHIARRCSDCVPRNGGMRLLLACCPRKMERGSSGAMQKLVQRCLVRLIHLSHNGCAGNFAQTSIG